MLKSLFIRNFVLIDSLDIKFDKGFSVITGETGAGKSIILGALSLVLGQRADGKSIKNGSEKCVIEAVFDVSRYKLEEFFLTNDLEYDAEICILRRVYNSSYTTTLLNYRDTELSFDYTEFEPLEYTENTLNSNLIATVVFYIYTILGLDFDSFSPKGGTAFFEQAMQIVSLAQAQPTWTGWKAFENDRNRHALATALTDNTSELFRDMWYNYHRKGLDEMAANPDRGRTTIIGLLPVLEQVKSARPTSPLLQMFADSKLDEVVLIYSKATTQEKQEGYKMLSNLYPALTTRMESLKK